MMIIFQILAAILLLPLTALMFILFNVYARHWLYYFSFSLFVFIYAMLCGILFHAAGAAVCVFIMLTVLYILRMSYIASKLHTKNNDINYPLIRANIESKKHSFHITLFFPLTFLWLAKLLPNALSKELIKQTGINMEIPELIELFLRSSAGTQIEILSEEADLHFEIQ